MKRNIPSCRHNQAEIFGKFQRKMGCQISRYIKKHGKRLDRADEFHGTKEHIRRIIYNKCRRGITPTDKESDQNKGILDNWQILNQTDISYSDIWKRRMEAWCVWLENNSKKSSKKIWWKIWKTPDDIKNDAQRNWYLAKGNQNRREGSGIL